MEELKISQQRIDQALLKVRKRDLSMLAQTLVIDRSGTSWSFDFFNRKILFDSNRFFSNDNQDIPLAIQLVLLTYINQCPENNPPESDNLISIRELSGNSPLFDTFISNSCKTICTQFSGQMELLKKKSVQIGGILNETSSYDLCITFMALPKVPLFLNFNDVDGPLPAQVSFLLNRTAQTYLDLTTVSILITYLVGQLIKDG